MRLNIGNDNIPFGTNIKNISVPEQMMKRFVSGLDYFDAAIGGRGFTPSTSMLFTGESGAGKTTMLLTVADRLSHSGVSVVYNTAEESLYQVKMSCDRLGLRKGFAVGSETNVVKLLKKADVLRTAATEAGKHFMLFVDSLQCMDDEEGGGANRQAENALFKITSWCKEHYTNAIIIGQVTKGGKFAGTNKLKHAVDAHIHLGFEKKDEDLIGCRVLTTEKNRFGGGVGDSTWLALGEKGFKVVAIDQAE